MTPSLEGWPTKGKEAPSPYEVRLTLLDTNPVFQGLWEIVYLAAGIDNCLPATFLEIQDVPTFNMWCLVIIFSFMSRAKFYVGS